MTWPPLSVNQIVIKCSAFLPSPLLLLLPFHLLQVLCGPLLVLRSLPAINLRSHFYKLAVYDELSYKTSIDVTRRFKQWMQERRCDNYLTLRTSIPIRSLGVSIIHCERIQICLGKWYKGAVASGERWWGKEAHQSKCGKRYKRGKLTRTRRESTGSHLHRTKLLLLSCDNEDLRHFVCLKGWSSKLKGK